MSKHSSSVRPRRAARFSDASIAVASLFLGLIIVVGQQFDGNLSAQTSAPSCNMCAAMPESTQAQIDDKNRCRSMCVPDAAPSGVLPSGGMPGGMTVEQCKNGCTSKPNPSECMKGCYGQVLGGPGSTTLEDCIGDKMKNGGMTDAAARQVCGPMFNGDMAKGGYPGGTAGGNPGVGMTMERCIAQKCVADNIRPDSQDYAACKTSCSQGQTGGGNPGGSNCHKVTVCGRTSTTPCMQKDVCDGQTVTPGNNGQFGSVACMEEQMVKWGKSKADSVAECQKQEQASHNDNNQPWGQNGNTNDGQNQGMPGQYEQAKNCMDAYFKTQPTATKDDAIHHCKPQEQANIFPGQGTTGQNGQYGPYGQYGQSGMQGMNPDQMREQMKKAGMSDSDINAKMQMMQGQKDSFSNFFYSGGPGDFGSFAQGQGQQESEADQQKRIAEQQKQMSAQMLQQALGECSRFNDPPSRIPGGASSAMQSKVQVLISKCKDLANSTFQNVTGDPGQAAQNFYAQKGSLYKELEGIMQDAYACDSVNVAVAGMEQGANQASSVISRVQQTNPDLAGQMDALRTDTLAALQTIKSDIAANNCGDAKNLMQALNQKTQEAMMKWGQFRDSFVGKDAMAQQLAQKFQNQGVSGVSAHTFSKKFSGVQDFTFATDVLNVGDADVANLLANDEGAQNIVKTLSRSNEDGKASQTVALLKQIADLTDQVKALTSQLSDAQAKVAQKFTQLTIAPEEASKLQSFLTDKLPKLDNATPAQLEEIYKKFERENGQYLVKSGQTSNIDINPRESYASDVIKVVTNYGIMKGNGDGTFAPGKDVNNAEALKTLVVALHLNVDPAAQPSDAKFDKYPAWGKPYAAAAEDAGLNVSALGSDASKPMKRGALAQLIGENLFSDQKNVDTSNAKQFTDIQNLDSTTKKDIKILSALGVVNGKANSDQFDPKGIVNRAQFAKFIGKASEAAGIAVKVESSTSGIPAQTPAAGSTSTQTAATQAATTQSTPQ